MWKLSDRLGVLSIAERICKSYTVVFEYTQMDWNKCHLGSAQTRCNTSFSLTACHQSDGLNHRSLSTTSQVGCVTKQTTRDPLWRHTLRNHRDSTH